jgi:hypothetical protein
MRSVSNETNDVALQPLATSYSYLIARKRYSEGNFWKNVYVLKI